MAQNTVNADTIEKFARVGKFVGLVRCAMGYHKFYYVLKSLRSSKAEWWSDVYCVRCGYETTYYRPRP